MIDVFGRESYKIVTLTECKCEEDFKDYLLQFYSKCDLLEGR